MLLKEKNYSFKEMIVRLYPFLRPYIYKYILALSLLVIASLLSLIPPYFLKVIIDRGIRSANYSLINRISISLIGVIVLSGILRWLLEYIHYWVSTHFIFDLRNKLFGNVLRQDMAFFSSVKSGDILGRLKTDVTAVYSVITNTFLGAISDLLQIIGIAIILFYINVRLAVIAMIFILPLYVSFHVFGRILKKLSKIIRAKDIEILNFFQERITNVYILKWYNRQKYEEFNLSNLGQDLIAITLNSVRYKATASFLIGIFTSVAGITIVWYGGYKVIEMTLSFGSLFAFYIYTLRFFNPIQSLATRGLDIFNGLASVERIVEYLDFKPTIIESEKPLYVHQIKGNIAFENVCFSYPNAKHHVLNGLNLQIKHGSKIAIVGSSGGGKTTMINLLGRLYDIESGRIKVDEHDICELSFESLYNAIAVIPQDNCLFNTSIEENIRYGRTDASITEIIDAAQKAELHDFIMRLPDGYKTVIGPRGAKLSGGQRQRIAIARLILKDAPIWVLDEFTSSLDAISESIIYENIFPMVRDKTVIVIAHRLSTVASADKILVMQNGVIVETGTHDDLYNRESHYRKLVNSKVFCPV